MKFRDIAGFLAGLVCVSLGALFLFLGTRGMEVGTVLGYVFLGLAAVVMPVFVGLTIHEGNKAHREEPGEHHKDGEV